VSAYARSFFEWCSERWTTVIWIPGDLEIWASGFTRVEHAVEAMKTLVSPFQNVHVLYCDAMGSEDGVVLLGCPLWRRPTDSVMLHVTGKIWAKSDPCPGDKSLFLYEYNRSRKWLSDYISGSEKPVVVLSCYAPLPWLTEEEWIQERKSSTNSPEMEVLLRRPVVAWLHGHCHVANTETYTWASTTGDVNSVLITSNPRGYPGRPSGYVKDAVVRIDPTLYTFSY
jgi:predicted phosphohydrolase